VIKSMGLAGSIAMPADFTPLYRQVMEEIRAKISSGEWPPGHRLPSTRDLAVQYDISPGTVREGVNRLLEAGDLRGHQGLGVFVAERPPPPV